MLAHLRTREGRDALLTMATEGLAMLGMIYAYRLAATHGSGNDTLGPYVIVRRTVSFGFPVLLLGAAIGLTRYVAMTRDTAMQQRYLRAALSWVLPLGALLMAVGAFFSAPLSWTVFGDATHAGLVAPLALMVVGIGLHGVAYAQLRGAGFGPMANLIQLLALAVSPCLAFLFFEELRGVLWSTAIAWTVVSLLVLAGLLVRGGSGGAVRRERAELLRFGLPRVPGDVAMGALLTVPVYVAARTHGLELGGQVGFGATLINLASAVFNPVALLLLPAAASRLASGDHARLAEQVGRLSRVMMLAAAALMIGFELLAGPLLRLYIGDASEAYLDVSRLCFLGALPFGYFFGMRSVLDAYFQTPRNGVNLLKAFGILVLGSFVHLVVPTPTQTMPVVMVVALWYLGWVTWRDVRYVRRELERIAARGDGAINVLVVIPDAESGLVYDRSKQLARELTGHGATVEFFHLEDRMSPLALVRARRRLKRAIRDARPDIVHVQYGSVAGLWTVLSSPLPVMVTFTGDDLDRSTVRGVVRPWLGGFFSQLAAFFAAGIICTDDRVRENLWWRTNEAHVIPLQGEGSPQRTLRHLRTVALHRQDSNAGAA